MEGSRFVVNDIESQPSQDQMQNGYLFHQQQYQRLRESYEKQQRQEDNNL